MGSENMTDVLDAPDPVIECHRRVGRALAESAFKEFGSSATEAQLFGLERLVHQQSDDFMATFGATDDQRLLAKIIIGHCLRARYADLLRGAPGMAQLPVAGFSSVKADHGNN